MFSPRYAIGRRRENVGCLPRHQITQHRIAETLLAYTKVRGGVACDTPIDVVFSDYDVLQPDVLYFKGGRAQLVDLDRPIRLAPDLCVEVLSPSTEATDRGMTMQVFARYGVGEYGRPCRVIGRMPANRMKSAAVVKIGIFRRSATAQSRKSVFEPWTPCARHVLKCAAARS